jgi:hypothetical protein
VAAPTETEVLAVDTEGTATVSFGFGTGEVVEPGGLGAAERAAIDQAIGALEGFRTTYAVDTRGFATRVDAGAAEGTGAAGGVGVEAIARHLPGSVQPLPEEPVGAGAVWTVERTTDVGGLLVRQAFTVELLALEDDLVELLFTVEDAAPAGGTGPFVASDGVRTEVRTIVSDSSLESSR